MDPRLAELLATVEARLTRLGTDAQTIVADPSQTVAPPLEVDFDDIRPDGIALELREVIGEGGMGVVHLATQRSLGRSVAVKRLRPGMGGERAVVALLREAWVTGAVEHPNVVPVHDIVRDETGAPMVVLKNIDGLDWSSLMRDEREVRSRFGTSDLLEWNLRVLVRVADAIAFAHSRGILHRDLKPDNVMVGEHGEVYVLDWGLAVTLDDRPRGPIPTAHDANELAGTPAYMAPEMLGGQGPRLGPSTDVYLLGAMLYEVLTGEPPHRGGTLIEILASIAGEPPRLPQDAPEELAQLVMGSLRGDPTERLADARQLARSIEEYLRLRHASSLARRAQERLDQLEELTTGKRRSLPGESPYQLFSECRFGFRHALEVWPESALARGGLARATESMVAFELEQGQPRTASSLLAEHPDPPAELTDRVATALRSKDAQDARRRALEDALDPRTGGRGRILMTALLGVAWVLQPLVTGVTDQLGWIAATHGSLAIRNVLQSLFILGLAYFFRASLRESAVNRTLLLGALSAAVAQMLLHGADAYLGVDVSSTTRHQFLVWAGIVIVFATSVDRVFALPALVYATSFVVLVFFEGLAFYCVAVGNVVLVATVLLWTSRARSRRSEEAGDPAREADGAPQRR